MKEFQYSSGSLANKLKKRPVIPITAAIIAEMTEMEKSVEETGSFNKESKPANKKTKMLWYKNKSKILP